MDMFGCEIKMRRKKDGCEIKMRREKECEKREVSEKYNRFNELSVIRKI